jgi:hypothetical protein
MGTERLKLSWKSTTVGIVGMRSRDSPRTQRLSAGQAIASPGLLVVRENVSMSSMNEERKREREKAETVRVIDGRRNGAEGQEA